MAGGDFKGAWKTVVTEMAAIWDSFVSGIVSAFARAGIAITGLWQKTVTGMANSLLAASMQDGVVGDAARLIVGRDLRKSEAKTERMRQRNILRGTRALHEDQNLLARKRAGDTRVKESEEELLGRIKADRQILEANGAPIDSLGDAQNFASESIEQTADSVREMFDGLEKRAEERAEASAEAAKKSSEGGGAGVDPEIERLEKELARLTAEAERKAADASVPTAEVADLKDRLPSDLSTAREDVVGTFSAAAAAALGGGQSVQEKLLKKAEKAEVHRHKTFETLEDIKMHLFGGDTTTVHPAFVFK